jgi:hypothetical protein
VANLPVGEHIVAFIYVSGWDTPGNQTVAVSLDSTNTVSTTYNTNSIALETWSGVAPTDWFNPLNWTPFGVPGPIDTVVLNDGGTITLSAPVTHNGEFLWSVGRISGGPNPLTLSSNAAMTISGSASHGLENCILTNQGTVVRNGGDIYGGGVSPGPVIYNQGLWDSQADASFLGAYRGNNIVFHNSGTFRKSAGAGLTQFGYSGVLLANTGNLDAQTGAIALVAGGNLSGGPVPAQLIDSALVGDNLGFSWATVSGQSYIVQQNTNLATTNWMFFTNLIGGGSLFNVHVPVTNAPQQFFRAREP